jgi:hypothetical protein
MSESKVWKMRAADLRRLANTTREAERERKMLVLAEQMEELERAQSGRGNDAREASPGEDGSRPADRAR